MAVRSSIPPAGTLRRRMIAVVGSAGILAAPALHAAESLQAHHFVRSTTRGQEVYIQHYAHWNRNCQPNTLPVVTVVSPPSHGTVSIRTGTEVVNNPPRTGDTDCTGKTMPAMLVWYTPSADFVGRDTFVYDVHLPEGTLHDSADVIVN